MARGALLRTLSRILSSFLLSLLFSHSSGLSKGIGHTALSNRHDFIIFMGSTFIPSPGSGWFSRASVICEQICPSLQRAGQAQCAVCSHGDIVPSQDRSPELIAVKPGKWFLVQFECPWHFMKQLRLTSLEFYNAELSQRLCLHAQMFSLIQQIFHNRLEWARHHPGCWRWAAEQYRHSPLLAVRLQTGRKT